MSADSSCILLCVCDWCSALPRSAVLILIIVLVQVTVLAVVVPYESNFRIPAKTGKPVY
jgi:hypothetical protein